MTAPRRDDGGRPWWRSVVCALLSTGVGLAVHATRGIPAEHRAQAWAEGCAFALGMVPPARWSDGVEVPGQPPTDERYRERWIRYVREVERACREESTAIALQRAFADFERLTGGES